MKWLYRLYTKENGAASVEYGLLIGLIAMVVIGAASMMFNSLHSPFGKINEPFNR